LSKIRIYQLSRDLGISNKELLKELRKLGIKDKTHSSSIDEETVELVMDSLTSEEKAERKEEKQLQKVKIPPIISMEELAEKFSSSVEVISRSLREAGVVIRFSQGIVAEDVAKIAKGLGYEIEVEDTGGEKLTELERKLIPQIVDPPESLKPRPPVVTVMGHVDHGKTSLLDVIRETNVIAEEFGGITQHIGAYQVKVNEHRIVFLDTPGHEAFTAMRARGAQATDIAILVVAADDGVMPQTIEAINHSRAAHVPIIVAINKIDKEDADPDKVKQQLMEIGLVPEEWGGDTICVLVSAKQKIGLDNLLEMISIVSELQELKANPDRTAQGVVLEARLDRGKGPLANVLIRKGTLKVGDTIVVGSAYGRVKAMMDDKGKRIKKAPPSTPVEVLGLSDVPEASDILYVVENEKIARQIGQERKERKHLESLAERPKASLDALFEQLQKGEVKELNIILKADVRGSVEAITSSLLNLSTDEVEIKIIHSGVGAVTESDVLLASASQAIIIGFNVRADGATRKMAKESEVDTRFYRVIYDVIADITAAIKGMLEPKYEEVILGRAEVRQLFKVPKVGVIAGSHVLEGKMVRNIDVRVLRDEVVVHEGKVSSLKRFKEDVREVAAGYECGIGIEKFNDIKENDIIEAFTEQQIEA